MLTVVQACSLPPPANASAAVPRGRFIDVRVRAGG